MHSSFLCASPHLPSTASRPPLPVKSSPGTNKQRKRRTSEKRAEKTESRRRGCGLELVPPCCCMVAACSPAKEDPRELLGFDLSSGSDGCCFPRRRNSLSLKSPSWNVSPSCHVCALAVLTGCQSTHTQTSERGQRGYTAEWSRQMLFTQLNLCLQTNSHTKTSKSHIHNMHT